MNGTQEIEVGSILEGTHNGVGNYYLRHKVTKSYLSAFFDTKEEAEKVLNSWRYADKVYDLFSQWLYLESAKQESGETDHYLECMPDIVKRGLELFDTIENIKK